MSNQLEEFKVIKSKKFEPLLTLLGLFIPVPMPSAQYTPDYVVNGWGLAYTIALSHWKIPLGWIMILIAILF